MLMSQCVCLWAAALMTHQLLSSSEPSSSPAESSEAPSKSYRSLSWPVFKISIVQGETSSNVVDQCQTHIWMASGPHTAYCL